MPVLIRSFITPDEIYPSRVVGISDAVAIASTLNRDEALHFVAFLNLLLSLATLETFRTGDLAPVRDVQAWLTREVISSQLLQDVRARLGAASLLDRPFLHRTQTLFALRLIATYGQTSGGNTLLVRQDFDAIGDLLLAINGLFHAGSAPKGGSDVLWLATHTSPLYEAETPTRIELSWPRVHELLGTYLPTAVSEPAVWRGLETVAVARSGFSTAEWLDLTFLLSSYWSAVPFRDLMASRERAYLDTSRDHATISATALSRAVEAVSVPFDSLPDYLKLTSQPLEAIYDLSLFHAAPIWRLKGGRAICVDASMLTERLGASAYWGVMNALETSSQRHHFSSAWGGAFETYTVGVLKACCAGTRWQVISNPRDPSTNAELWDAVAIHQGRTALVVECKGTFMQAAAKYSGELGTFFRGLTKKFGNTKGGAVRQLSVGVSKALHRGQGGTCRYSPLTSVEEIFPVLVGQDRVLDSGPVIRLLSDRFLKASGRRLKNLPAKIWPLTVIGADTLEHLAVVSTTTGEPIHQILKTFHRKHRSRAADLGTFLRSDPRRFRSQESAALTSARFRSVADAAMERFSLRAFH